MESASSRIMILYGGQGYPLLLAWSAVCDDFTLDETVTRAKFLIFSRTIEIPRSSEAFNSRTRVFINSGLQLVSQQVILPK